MIYLHVPFCRSFCTYCGFYSELAGSADFKAYADSICREAEARRDEITNDIPTLYIGGGTPSVLPLDVLGRIVGALSGAGPFREFTMEVNPEDICEKGIDYVRGLRELGVNRISMGVQSLDDGCLRWMNRRHDSARAVEAVRILREAGVDNLGLDLIFGYRGLTDDIWENTVSRVLELHPEHISAYQLSVDEGSALYDMALEGRYTEAPDEDCARQYGLLCRRLDGEGYVHYEISNFALPGREAVHNSAYWQRAPYVGLGPGAHSFDGKRRSWNSQTLPDYCPESEELDAEDEKVEIIMLSLRTARGLDEKTMRDCCDESAVERLLGEGLLVRTGSGALRIPEERYFPSDDIIRQLI